MPASLAPLIALLRVSPAAPCRLEGLRFHDGSGGPARSAPLGLRGGRFTLAPDTDLPRIALDGWTLLPGLCDAHFHLWHEARRGLRVNLGGIRRRGELEERLAAADPGAPLLAVDWDESEWDDPRPPTRRELDTWLPGRPVCLIRVCGHVAVVSGATLKLLAGGENELDLDPVTGLAREGAVAPLARLFPPEPEALRRELRAVAERLAAEGLTAITEMGSDSLPEKAAALPDDFPLRVDYFHAGPVSELPSPAGGPARPLGRKFFLDGSIGGRTAAVAPAYSGGGSGQLLLDDGELRGAVAEVLAGGWMVALHAIGERAIEQAVCCLEDLRPPPGRARLEHLETASSGALQRCAALGTAACLQPNFMERWGRPGGLYEQRLGVGWRERFAGPGKIRRAGATLAYGTDGMPAQLWPALRAAVDPEVFGEDIDDPSAALAAVTGDAAAAAGQAGRRGRVEEGEAADFCLVSGDPVAENFLERPAVALTVLGGRPSWIHPEWQGR